VTRLDDAFDEPPSVARGCAQRLDDGRSLRGAPARPRLAVLVDLVAQPCDGLAIRLAGLLRMQLPAIIDDALCPFVEIAPLPNQLGDGGIRRRLLRHRAPDIFDRERMVRRTT
jgi:hypothetical protein